MSQLKKACCTRHPMKEGRCNAESVASAHTYMYYNMHICLFRFLVQFLSLALCRTYFKLRVHEFLDT